MPPSGFNRKAIKALVQFLEACYEDLLEKVRKKHPSPNVVEEAIEEELDQLRSFLQDFTAQKPESLKAAK